MAWQDYQLQTLGNGMVARHLALGSGSDCHTIGPDIAAEPT